MKKIKLLLTTAISLLLVTAWAEGTNANLTSVKDLAAELLGIYAPEPNTNTGSTPDFFIGEGKNKTISPKEVGWPSSTVKPTDQWTLVYKASRTDIKSRYNDWGTPMLCTRANSTNDYTDGAFKLYQATPKSIKDGSNEKFRFVANNNGTYNYNPTNGKDFDVTIVFDGAGIFTVTAKIDGTTETKNNVKVANNAGVNNFSGITNFSHYLPAGFNITEFSIVPTYPSKINVTPVGFGTPVITYEGEEIESGVSVPKNKQITLTATSHLGANLSQTVWKNGDATLGTGETITFTATDDEYNITAEFVGGYDLPTFDTDSSWIKNTSHHYLEVIREGGETGTALYGPIATPNDLGSAYYHLVNTEATAVEVTKGDKIKIYWKSATLTKGNMQVNAFCALNGNLSDYHHSYGTITNGHSGYETIEIPTTDARIGYTVVRIRLDEGNAVAGTTGSPTAQSKRLVYDIIVNIVAPDVVKVNASYESLLGSVTATATGVNGLISSFPVTLEPGANVTLTATPKYLCEFQHWVDENGDVVSTNKTITLNNLYTDINYTAVFYIDGTHTFKCDAGLHDWQVRYKAMGAGAAIEGTDQPAGAGHCDGGCSVTIPGHFTFTTQDAQHNPQNIEISLVQVGTTIIHGQRNIKILTLPNTIEEIRRSKVLDLSSSKLSLVEADIPTGIYETHAGEDGANKWEVTPEVTGHEEWWFVGVFDFPTASQFNTTDGGKFKDWGCALLTSRKWPAQKNDNWTNMFQIWVDGSKSHNKHASEPDKYPERVQGDIRLVNDRNSAKDDPYFLYFKDKDGNHINVLDNEGVGKIVRFEVHNYPDAGGSGSTVVYSVITYDKATYGTADQRILQEGSIETHVDNLQPISWISNYVPNNVQEQMLKFYRPQTHMITYRDGVTETDEFKPTEDCTITGHTGKKITLKENMLTTNEPWMMAIHYIPEVTERDEIIIATDDDWDTNISAPIYDGFRIVQKASDNYLYFQSSYPTAAQDIKFDDINITPGYPLTIIVYHYPDGKLVVSATDRLNNQIEKFTVMPQIKAALSTLHTQCTYAKHTFDVTVATTEHLLFANCPFLEQINVTNNTYYKSIDGAIYDYPGYTLILWPEGKVYPCKDLTYHNDDEPFTVVESPYASNHSEVVLPSTVRRIAPLAFLNVRDNETEGGQMTEDGIQDLTVHVDQITEVDRLSYVNATVTYETTPQHFLEMKKNDQISFRLNLMQGTSNVGEGYLDRITPKTYSQIALPDRFASATVGNWNTFTVPFDVTADEIATNFSSKKDGVLSPRKLTSADVYYDKKTGRRILRVKFAEQTELEAGVPYIVRVDDVTKSVEQGGHNGEVRFGYHPFKTALHPVASVEDGGVESIRATEDESLAENGVTVDYTYDVSMLANIDPQNFTGTDSETLNNGGYEYTLMLTNNVFKQVGAGKTAKNKGYRGWLKIVATPTNNGAGQATSNAPIVMDMYMDDNNDATAILEVRPDNEITADGKPVDVYSTSGIRLGNSLDRLPAGVYIINNKKVVKK